MKPPDRMSSFLRSAIEMNPVAVHADVTGLEPALRRKDACGLFGGIQIAFKDLRSTNDNFPGLSILNVERIVIERDEA